MLRICLSCQPLKTELQMGMEPQKTFYTTDGSWIDWNPIALEKTPNTPLGKAENNVPKGGWPKTTPQRISRRQKKVPKGGIREMRAIKTQGIEEIARFANTWSRNSWVSSISRVVIGAFLEFLEPSIAFGVFVEKLTLVFHLFNILCTLSKRLGVGFYSTAMGFNLIRKPSVV